MCNILKKEAVNKTVISFLNYSKKLLVAELKEMYFELTFWKLLIDTHSKVEQEGQVRRFKYDVTPKVKICSLLHNCLIGGCYGHNSVKYCADTSRAFP